MDGVRVENFEKLAQKLCLRQLILTKFEKKSKKNIKDIVYPIMKYLSGLLITFGIDTVNLSMLIFN